MTTIPVLDWIIVRIERQVNPTTGLVLRVPSDAGLREVTVHAVGPGRPSEYSGTTIEYRRSGFDHSVSPVSPGQRILIPSGAGAGMEQEEGDVKYRWVRPHDVLGIVPDAAGERKVAA